ncbi:MULTISPECIES: MFS transporter [Halobacterium]|uniref:Major facilitator superfamily transport protein n=4 Tax=Halobacterium salinarum TaxID=2242 RepID=Q9HS33_HALSA|nr:MULTISPECIES: MFS transporter [Halobacterium]AAG18975.1 multidrug resistance protein homolog [Halobacterium salinarum NRC-1]MBB6089808.1 MFS family permease [Halobacterium salinarum]MCF2164101.1 MFS transporter [Halobacterium salinarum]MCF2167823.1 MFS transporter [Halobacterium salinarum]MCF2207658.1 MFS transporter [Halobacterium salinarum]
MGLLDTDRRVLTLALARMADALGNSFLIVLLPAYIGEGYVAVDSLTGPLSVAGVSVLTVTPALLIGIVLSTFGFLNSFLQPFTGRLSDRTGVRKPFILGGLVLLALASGAYAFVSDYRLLLVLRALQGIGAALTVPATVALVSELGTTETRGSNFGVFNTFRLIGFGFGPIIAGVVLEVFSFNAAFGVAAAGALTSFVLVELTVDEPDTDGADAGDDLSIAVRGDDAVLDPVFALGIATVAMGICIAMFATLEAKINGKLDQSSILFGAEFGAVTLANVMFQVPIGTASDTYGRRPFIIAGFIILIPATIAQGYAPTPATMILARFVQGIAVAAVFAPSLAVAGDLAGAGESGSTLAVLTMGFGLGTAIGPLASGFLAAYGLATPFLIGGVLAALALAVVYTQVYETVPDATAVSASTGD